MVKSLLFYLAMLVSMLALLEGFSFVAVQVVDPDNYFDTRASVLARLNEAGLAEFRAKSGDPVTGWRSYGASVHDEDNCLGESITYSLDAAGARLYEQFDAAATEVVIVGDSYTRGDEIADNETYPARLSQLLGVSVANLGVGGYGPTQAVLNLRQNIASYPHTRVVVLAIMYENIYRMMNSYRPVLYGNSSDYTFKPYMQGGEIIPHPGSAVLESLEQFKQAAHEAFDNDFWARPKLGFPYLLSLVRSLSSKSIYYRKVQKEFRKVGKPEYFLIFDSPEIKLNLVVLLNKFTRMAREWDVQPVAVFIPRNRLDISSAATFIEQQRGQIDAGLIVGDVAGFADVDWLNFNLQEENSDNICHPSPYGAATIAAYIAQLLREKDVWPAR
jgi:hypothetical protein